MQARAKKINPRLAFLPLMYFPEINAPFVERYRKVIDGVVAAYPPGRQEIDRAWAVLNDAVPAVAGQPSDKRKFSIPFFVMTAGDIAEFRLRHGEPASPERISQRLRMCLKARDEGKCDGVVTYCLDKGDKSATFEPAVKAFREFPNPK